MGSREFRLVLYPGRLPLAGRLAYLSCLLRLSAEANAGGLNRPMPDLVKVFGCRPAAPETRRGQGGAAAAAPAASNTGLRFSFMAYAS